jgi:lipid II:glycine glycyltransferase (peptidoglycan interpeptide bridge formation enzyme)
MKFSPHGKYKKIAEVKLAQGTAVAWISHVVEDRHWDEFLQSTSLGQFQQSAMWAQAKSAEGWKPARVIFTLDDQIVGGFQTLWRSSWRGNMGYVSKGPVVSHEYPELSEFAADLLTRLASSERLRLLVVQPPDLCDQFSPRMAARGFELDALAGVNQSTWIIDLSNGFPAVEEQMSKWTRKKIRQAVNRGVRVREGMRQDVPKFFQLMLATCRRQGVAPAPSDEKSMLALWDAAASANCIRLTFAEHEGKELAGLISILFGETVSL